MTILKEYSLNGIEFGIDFLTDSKMSASAVRRIVPLLDRVLVQKMKPLEKTASGILIPEKAQESLSRGRVIAVGPGAFDSEGKRQPVSVASGDVVILPTYGGTPVKHQAEEDLFLFRESELLAKEE